MDDDSGSGIEAGTERLPHRAGSGAKAAIQGRSAAWNRFSGFRG